MSSHAPLVEEGIKLWLTNAAFSKEPEDHARNKYATG